MTRLRPMLSAVIHAVIAGQQLVITRRGRKVAAMVPYPQLERIWDGLEEEDLGPINPETGRRYGRQWVKDNFGGRYLRRNDPDEALRPRKSEAPWVGHSFAWPMPGEEATGETVGKPVREGGPRVRRL